MRHAVLKNPQKWFLGWHCISILHGSVGAESWKRLSAVATVNPQEDKESGHQKLLPTAMTVQFWGWRRMQNSLWVPIWDLLSLPSFWPPIYARQTQGLSLPKCHCEMVQNKLGRDWMSGSCKKTPWHPVQSLWPLGSFSETLKSPGKSSACLSCSGPPPTPMLPRHALLSWAIPLLTPHHSLLTPQKTLHQKAASHACS